MFVFDTSRRLCCRAAAGAAFRHPRASRSGAEDKHTPFLPNWFDLSTKNLLCNALLLPLKKSLKFFKWVLGVRLSLIQVKQSIDLTSAFHGRGGAAEPLGLRPAFPFQDSELFFRRITVALSFYLHPPTHIPFIFSRTFPLTPYLSPSFSIFYFLPPSDFSLFASA